MPRNTTQYVSLVIFTRSSFGWFRHPSRSTRAAREVEPVAQQMTSPEKSRRGRSRAEASSRFRRLPRGPRRRDRRPYQHGDIVSLDGNVEVYEVARVHAGLGGVSSPVGPCSWPQARGEEKDHALIVARQLPDTDGVVGRAVGGRVATPALASLDSPVWLFFAGQRGT